MIPSFKIEKQANTRFRDNATWFNTCDVVKREVHVWTVQGLKVDLAVYNPLASKGYARRFILSHQCAILENVCTHDI